MAAHGVRNDYSRSVDPFHLRPSAKEAAEGDQDAKEMLDIVKKKKRK